MDGNAIIYCEGAYNTPNGKTAHGLVRFTERYKVLSVIDSGLAGQDAGIVLDGIRRNIPIHATLEQSLSLLHALHQRPEFFVMGIAPDGGRLSDSMKEVVKKAVESGMNIDSGLHDFITNYHDIVRKAIISKVMIRDIRKPPEVGNLHFFTGKIKQVMSMKLAVLGTDSAVGKRTTAWVLVHHLRKAGIKTEMVGTGQTAWMQGARYGIIMDSLINDFVSGELEHAIFMAWEEIKPDVIFIEGQGSLMNPAYPGGFEILAAGRPDYIILQHAPRRKDYDGFPGHNIQPIDQQVRAINCISGSPILAITLNHENMEPHELKSEKARIRKLTGLPVFDPLWESAEELTDIISRKIRNLQLQ